MPRCRAWLTPAAEPVHNITVIPHGQALGVTSHLPGEGRYKYSHLAQTLLQEEAVDQEGWSACLALILSRPKFSHNK
jgi:ATP-dependent Zn protease